MSGADLANLVNEAALHAVRRGSLDIAMADFETARDRVLLGQRRESMVLSEAEKERIAYHEGGHAVLAYVLEHADPVHKVTILPDRHGARRHPPAPDGGAPHPPAPVHRGLAVRAHGRPRAPSCSSTATCRPGAANDLVGNTELARKMVREWGMSDAIGPMAWGSQGQVFLGEDLMHTRDYSEDTSKVIDDEVERILRVEEQRAMDVLSKHRGGLNAIARALLDNEIIDGAEVARLVDEAHGSPVHDEGAKSVPHFHEAAISRAGRQRRQRQRQRRRRARRRRHGGEPRTGPVAVPAAPRHRPARPSPRRGLPRRGPRREPRRPAPRRAPPPARARCTPSGLEPIRAAQRHEGGWWSTSSQTGSRTATWPPSVPPA